MSGGHHRFFWKLFRGNAALLIGVVASCVWLIIGAFDDFSSEELTSHLRTHAEVLRHDWGGRFEDPTTANLDHVAKEIGRDASERLRITFIAADGTVLGDSQAQPAQMENHANRQEFRQAMRDGLGESTRWSKTVRQQMKYVAVRVDGYDRRLGVVRVSMPVKSIVARTQSARHLFWRFGAIVLLAAVALALGLARLWSRRIGRVTATARSLSRGDLSARADVDGKDELALLASSLNQMRDHIANQLETIDHQRRTLEYLLAQVHEGVVVAGPDGRIVLLNPAAAKLFRRDQTKTDNQPGADGITVDECVPNESLREMLQPRGSRSTAAAPEAGAAKAPKIEERRVTLDHGGRSVALLARAANIRLPGLRGADAEPAGDSGDDKPAKGRLLVLTDITELTRTIQMKTDFVANASHELRTPLSAIRAAVETVMSVDLAADGESAMRILGVIDRQSARLSAIVTDLLELSRVESPAATFDASEVGMSDIVAEVRDRAADAIAVKHLDWSASVDPQVETVVVNRHLLRLVLDNLVDNATKFTDDRGRVRLDARRCSEGFAVTVEDAGCGIPREEQERVFERFYQVERARSGSSKRGTGLGLSIVRHAVNALNGRIELWSEPGVGTRITVVIPQVTASDAAHTCSATT